jgi:hypothetical protein
LHKRSPHISGQSGKNISEPRLKREKRRCNSMSTRSNNLVNPNAREAMNRFKMEAAGDLDVYSPQNCK